jgi:hypothetical protein
MRRAPEGKPTWKRPFPYGISEAIGAAGTVVAPLLAGFSVTLIVLTLQVVSSAPAPAPTTGAVSGEIKSAPPPQILHPDIALALLVAATAALLAAVQCAFWARQYQANPEEIEWWWGDLDDLDDEFVRSNWEMARREQIGLYTLQMRWIGRFRIAYHAGILLVLGALVVLLIPSGDISIARGTAIGLAILATLAEIAWIVATELAAHWGFAEPERPSLGRRLVRSIVPRYVPGNPEDPPPRP